jgi:hypothetical protein
MPNRLAMALNSMQFHQYLLVEQLFKVALELLRDLSSAE